MGETYIALGDGLDTLYWNPAGLAQLASPTASFMHSFWIQDIGTEYLAYGLPLGPLGAVGGGLSFLHAGSVTETFEDQYGNYAGEGGQVSAMSFALIGTYAQKLSRLMPVQDPFFSNMLVGASLRIVTESIEEASIFGGALDIGVIWRQTEEIKPMEITSAAGLTPRETGKPLVRDRGWRLGLVGQNLGMTSDQLMPINLRAGAGYVLPDLFSPNGRGTMAVDVLVPIDNDVKISVGAEYAHLSPNTEFAARVGYKIGNEIKDLDSLAGLTAGVGVAIQAGFIKYQVDYAFVPYGELGSTHRASLTLGFLPSANVVKTQPVSVVPSGVDEIAPPLAASAKPAEPKPVVKAQTQPKPQPAAETVPVVKPEVAQPVEPTAPAPAAEPGKLAQALRMFQKRMEAKLIIPVQFDTNKSIIPDGSKKSLDMLGKILEQNPQGQVVITGYAGTDAKLAEARAQAVARYLKMTYSVASDRLEVRKGDAAAKPKNVDISVEAK
ncbi:MAG: PorV/PorQ family protein [candidate division FCPU426 bacterium]